MNEPVHLSRFRADVSRALARRGKNLLADDRIADRVAELEPLEAYFIVKELGVDDALPILRHASQEQIQTFVDLDCWRGDTPDPIEVDAWLAPFAADGKEAVARAFATLESEIQILFLQHALHIHDARADDVPPAHRTTPRMTTPDGAFVLDAPHADALEINVLALVDALYAEPGEAFRLLMAVKWELPSPLAERAHRFRASRIESLGFPNPVDARAIFARPPDSPPEIRVPPPPTALPAVYAAPLTEGTLLARALGSIAESSLLDLVEHDLVYLINAAVIAYGEAPRDLRHTTEIAARVRDTVSLGLETLLGNEVATPEASARAAALLDRWPVRDLYRHGHSQALRLQRKARVLLDRPAVAEWLATVETEANDYDPERANRELMRALLLPAALYGGFDPLRPERTKAFACRAEITAAEERLEQIADAHGSAS
jgi:hypothetical protein